MVDSFQIGPRIDRNRARSAVPWLKGFYGPKPGSLSVPGGWGMVERLVVFRLSLEVFGLGHAVKLEHVVPVGRDAEMNA